MTITDDEGVRHSVTVVGSSLYEAAALAIKQLQQAAWVAGAIRSSARLEVDVLQPAERHSLSVEQLLLWTQQPPKSPQEKLLKDRLAELVPRSVPARRRG